MFTIRSLKRSLNVQINGVTIPIELNTGSSVTITSGKLWQEKLPYVQLQKTDIHLRTYTCEPLKVLGQRGESGIRGAEGQITLSGSSRRPYTIWQELAESYPAELVNHLASGLEDVLQKYSHLLQEELGTM